MEEFREDMVQNAWKYFNPLIKGALFKYTGKRGYIEAYIDWRSRQTTTEREIFTLASSANVAYKRVNAGYFLTVNHFARMVEATDDQHVMDNIMFNPHIGFDFSGFAFLDKFTIRAGALVSLNRDRGVGATVWIIPKGFLGDVNMEWKFSGAEST